MNRIISPLHIRIIPIHLQVVVFCFTNNYTLVVPKSKVIWKDTEKDRNMSTHLAPES